LPTNRVMFVGQEPFPSNSQKIRIGASPSGKAPLFGSGIRRFESFRPSQFLNIGTAVCPNTQAAVFVLVRLRLQA
jgi:hypothetical protein